ncbi:MAG: hypothetical protein JO161_06370, partial [Planctomycetaceae bacterium]|nr:hypothetical protein [Planctomycetaceae bacterium]
MTFVHRLRSPVGLAAAAVLALGPFAAFEAVSASSNSLTCHPNLHLQPNQVTAGGSVTASIDGNCLYDTVTVTF